MFDLLGAGSYGNVYQGTDTDAKKIAIKTVKGNTNGLNCILEAILMRSFTHPFLMSSDEIHIRDNALYILQPLASHDLKDPKIKSLSPDQKAKIIFQLLHAVSYLHRNDLIHGDIKANNVLMMHDGSVKLTDYSLTRHMDWSQFHPTTGTSTHRAPEIWLQRPYGKPSDIWALGCTVFEILYGRLLFEAQKTEITNDIDNATQIYKSLQAIYIWGQLTRDPTPVPQYDVACRFPVLPTGFGSGPFDAAILSMLRIDPNRRPTIDDLLTTLAPHFTNFHVPEFKETKLVLSTDEPYRFDTKTPPDVDTAVLKVMKLLSNKIREKPGLKLKTKYIKEQCLLWSASKIVFGRPIIKPPISPDLIFAAERDLWTHLNFRFDG
jgi:serine/threonine protein kinase